MVTSLTIKKQRRWLLSVVILFFSCAISAKKADSLLAVLKSHTQNDTTRVILLSEIARTYKDNDLDSMAWFSKEGLALAKQINFEKEIAYCSQSLGLVYLRSNDYDKALDYYRQALNIYEKSHNKPHQVEVLLSMGDIYYRMTKYDRSIEYYDKTIALSEEINDLKTEGLALIDIGGIYTDQSNYSEAINYYLKGLKIFEKQNDNSGISMTFVNIATIYSAMGNYKVALDYINKSLPVTKGISDREVIFSNMVNIGVVYSEMKDYKNALIAFNNGMSLADSMGDKTWKNIVLVNIADVYYKTGRYDIAYEKYNNLLTQQDQIKDTTLIVVAKAAVGSILVKRGKVKEGIRMLLETLEIAQSKQIKQTVFDASRDLSSAYEQIHDYRRALEYHKIYYGYRDSLYNEKNDKRIQQLQFDYALGKKEHEIALLNMDKTIQQSKNEKQKTVVWALLSVLILLIVTSMLLYRNNRYEKRTGQMLLKQKEEIQIQATRLEELNTFKDKTFSVLSHDLRGPLNSFLHTMSLLDKEIITPDEFMSLKPELHSQLNSLSILLDNLLNWAKSYMQGKNSEIPETINLYEVAWHNISLFEDAADKKKIKIHNNIPGSTTALGYSGQIDIVIRNLIMNAIKFNNIDGIITLDAASNANTVQITVADNGVGMTDMQLNKLFTATGDNSTYGTIGEKGIGLGLLLCYEFIKANNGTISAKSEVNKGSTFTIILPVPKDTAGGIRK